MEKELLEYHIKETNRRLEGIEDKLDELTALKAQAALLAVVISLLVGGGINLIRSIDLRSDASLQERSECESEMVRHETNDRCRSSFRQYAGISR